MVNVKISNKYGTVVGESISNYCVNVHVEGYENRGKYAVLKSIENVTREDLEKASEEIMAREVKKEEE